MIIPNDKIVEKAGPSTSPSKPFIEAHALHMVGSVGCGVLRDTEIPEVYHWRSISIAIGKAG